MVLKRIMPCLLVQDKRLVKTINFDAPNYIGDPINAIKIYNDKEVDELVILDILSSKKNTPIDFDLLTDCAAECFMPLAYGGGVRTLADFMRLFSLGIEKVIVNTLLFDEPDVIQQAIEMYGSQSIIASVDVKTIDGNATVYSHSGRTVQPLNDHLAAIVALGVGEVLLTSVDNEGTWKGYDRTLAKTVSNTLPIPMIVNGGCGSHDDLDQVLNQDGLNAAAIGSMAVYQKKDMGVLIRFPKREQIITDEYPF